MSLSRTLSGLLLISLLAACSSISATFDFVAELFEPAPEPFVNIAVQSSTDMNDYQAAEVHLVFVLKEDAAALIPGQAVQWFADEPSILLRAGDKIRVVRLQIPPGYSQASLSIPKDAKTAVKAVLFSSYKSPSEKVGKDFTAYKNLLILLTRDRIELHHASSSASGG